MQENYSPSRSVAPGHILLALIVAAAVAVGLHYGLHYRTVQTATAAELSFDPQLAHRFDSGMAQVHDPAVALAQTLLTDAEIEKLSSSANLTSTSAAGRLGEFRARLQLSQPSASTLRVRFLNPDGAPAIEATNTIAQALANLHPSTTAAPLTPPPAPAPVKTSPPPAPVKKAQPAPTSSSASALAASTGELDTLLSSTKHDLDNLAASGAGGHPSDPAAYRESDQQHLLRARVNAAEQKLADIRKSPAAQNLSGADSARLGEMQHAVASIVTAGVGVDATRLRRERAQLDDAIALVHRDQLAFQSEAPSAGSDTAASTPPPANPPTTTASQPPATPPPTQQQPTDENILPNPLSFARPASPANPTPWWPTILAGLFFGLVYFLLVPRRSPDYVDYDEPEPVATGYNFITPSIVPRSEPAPEPPVQTRPESRLAPYPEARVEPVVEPPRRPMPEPLPSWQPAEDRSAEDRSPRRASFRFERAAAPEPPAPIPPAPKASPAEPPANEVSTSTAKSISASELPELHPASPQPAAEVLRPQEPPLSAATETASGEPESDPLFDFFAPDPPASKPRPPSGNGRSGEVLSAERGHAFTEAPPAPDAPPAPPSILLDTQSEPAAAVLVESPAAPEIRPETPVGTAVLSHDAVEVPPQNGHSVTQDLVPLADTWADDIRRALAQTEIGRRFDGPDSNGDAPQGEDLPAHRNGTDRLAG